MNIHDIQHRVLFNKRILGSGKLEVCAYEGVSRDQTIRYPNGRRLRIILYGGCNLWGMIGTENNGIAILDEDRNKVLLDRHCDQKDGFHGPSQDQLREWDRLTRMDWDSIQIFLRTHPRGRNFDALPD